MDKKDTEMTSSEQEKPGHSDFAIEFKTASFSWPETTLNQNEDNTKQNGHLVIKNGPYKG